MKCILNVSTIQITVIFVLFSYKSLHRPVSKATTLEEEITTGHSADLTRLLQPASTTEEERAINIYVMLCPLFFVFQVLWLTCRRPDAPLHTSTDAYRPQV